MLDRVLQAKFMRWHEDRGDSELKAESHHAPEGIGKRMLALKARVIVELRITGPAVCLPVGADTRDNRRSGGTRQWPRRGQASTQRNPGEDIEQWTILEPEILDDIEEIDFTEAAGNSRQMPARRWCGSSQARALIDRSIALEDATDRTHCRNFRPATLGELSLLAG